MASQQSLSALCGAVVFALCGADLARREEQLRADRNELEAEKEQLTGEQGDLARREEQLRADRNELEAEKDQLTGEQGDLARREEQLRADRNELEAEKEQLQADHNDLEAEKEKIMRSAGAISDILEINAGGTVVMVKRSTLLMAPKDSMLHAMFSGRWDDSLARDNQNRIFLEMTPDVFFAILSHLRAVQNGLPRETCRLPQIPDYYRDELETAWRFYGMTFSKPVNLQMRSEFLTVSEDTAGTDIELPHPAADAYAPAVGVHALEDATTWKVIAQHLPQGGWMFTGVIANASPAAASHRDPTSFGWNSLGGAHIAGRGHRGHSGWQGMRSGDTVIFKLQNQKLKMYLCRTKSTYALDLPSSAGQWRLHLNMDTQGTVARISTPTDEEQHLVM